MLSLLRLDPAHYGRILQIIDDENKACHLIFRVLGPQLQAKFCEMADLSKVPKVFIHGNPHLDNYARTSTGAGLIDFDRSRVGPYAWDIIRFYSSLSLRGEDNTSFLTKKVSRSFLDGYMTSFEDPNIYFAMPHFLREVGPTPDETSTSAYLKANIKWAKKMRKNPLDVKDEKVLKLLRSFLESRNELSLLKEYKLQEAGISEGSLGKNHYLLALTPKKSDTKGDPLLLDLKETYQEENTIHFFNPVRHNGLRMVKASNLYAPGVEQRLGYFTYGKTEFWGREVPAFNYKIKHLLSEKEQSELAYCVGSQLGRGHRRSCREVAPKVVSKHLRKNIKEFANIGYHIQQEILLSYEYLAKSKKLEQQLITA